MKKGGLIISVVSVCAAILFSGCSSKATPKYTATFIDAKVSGVDYVCDGIKSKTDKDGKFTCPVGVKVDFSVGPLKLLTIDPNKTKFRKNPQTGEVALFVKDAAPQVAAKIAAVLLTLDSDGDPDNGITLPKEADEIIKEVIPTPTSIDNIDVDDKVDDIAEKAEEKIGKDFEPKTIQDATNHLNDVEQKVKEEFSQEVEGITGGEG